MLSGLVYNGGDQSPHQFKYLPSRKQVYDSEMKVNELDFKLSKYILKLLKVKICNWKFDNIRILMNMKTTKTFK